MVSFRNTDADDSGRPEPTYKWREEDGEGIIFTGKEGQWLKANAYLPVEDMR